MHTKPKVLKDEKLGIAKEKLLQNLRLIVADTEAHLYTNATHPGEDEAAAKARIQGHLRMVKSHLIAADTPVFTDTKIPGQYVHNNPWRSIGISACANMIVAMQNARH